MYRLGIPWIPHAFGQTLSFHTWRAAISFPSFCRFLGQSTINISHYFQSCLILRAGHKTSDLLIIALNYNYFAFDNNPIKNFPRIFEQVARTNNLHR